MSEDKHCLDDGLWQFLPDTDLKFERLCCRRYFFAHILTQLTLEDFAQFRGVVVWWMKYCVKVLTQVVSQRFVSRCA